MLVQDTAELIAQMGAKELRIDIATPIDALPTALEGRGLTLAKQGAQIIYTYDTRAERTGITALLNDLAAANIQMTDLATSQSSLEDIFVGLMKETA